MLEKSAELRKKVALRGADSAKNAGFTLIELMIVVVIIGVMATIAGSFLVGSKTDQTVDGHYQTMRASVAKCRAAAFNSPHGTTIPTSWVVYENGYACVAWDDKNADRHIGAAGAIPKACCDGLTPGDAAGEIIEVFFEERFDRSLDFATRGPKVWVDLAFASAQYGNSRLPLDGDAKAGYAFVFSPSGYLMAADRTLRLGGNTSEARIYMNSERRPAVLGVLPSGQLEGGVL